MKIAIQCKYSCNACHVHRQSVTVEAREDQDVVTWLNTVCVPAMMRDHETRSPGCNPGKFDEVMIPLKKDGGKVGEAL